MIQNDSETGTIFFATSTNFIQMWQKHWQPLGQIVHFKPTTNLELSNALAHDAKLVPSFIT